MAQHHNPADRTNAQQWARNLFEQANFYILDTETTGVSKKDQIVQLGVVDKNGAVVLDTLVKSTVPIHPAASEVNGITQAMLNDAPTFMDIYTTISAKLAGAHIVAYNMDFDWRMLQQTAAAFKMPLFRTTHRHCAMKQYAAFRGTWNPHRRSYRWHKLTEAAAYEKIEVKDAHSALGDVLMTLKLLEKMAE